MKRKICVITGTRAEYGLLKPVMRAIELNRSLKLVLIVTGMHLSSEFGNTFRLIKNDGFKIPYRVEMNPKNDSAGAMAWAIGRGILGISKVLETEEPAISLILGDRIEALAGAIASAYHNIAIAHIHGGERTKAGLDESARHAITKISHIHFAATKKSSARIIKMGEKSSSVFLVGAPGIDSILNASLLSLKELSKKYKFNFTNKYLLVLQHSVTTQIEQSRYQIRETIGATKYLKTNTVIIYPNSDAGGRIIIKEIEKLRNLSYIKIFKNLPHHDYLSFLKNTSVLIGNSSSGIIETPSFKVPVVNIGIRQEGRERSTNIIDTPHCKKEIIKAINKALYDKLFLARIKKCRNHYGDGCATGRIVKILSTIKINNELLQKQIAY